MNEKEKFYVVAIGASAGGLKALEDFFSNVPSDTGMAFIVIQHLSPDYKSLMVELLSKKTNMKVLRAENEMPIIKNRVYLIPPKMNMSVYQSHLILSEQDHHHGINLPIDIFFKSLAKDAGEMAMGVILSGTGSDGTSGLKDIKENGGLVIVQDPESAQFDGMPRSAINTELVDFILPPEEIADKLITYANSLPISIEEKSKLLSSKQDGLLRIFSLIRDKHKIDYSYYKMSTMVRRIERRMYLNQIGDLQEYIRYLEKNSREVSSLCRDLLIGVTSFFRDDEAFSVLEKDIIPQLIQKNENKEIRVWVAGCSSGEEAYSVAILFNEYLEKNGNKVQVKIFATDVDQESVIKAGNGLYVDSILNEVNEQRMSKYFLKLDVGFKISRKIREMVVFAKHNLVKDPPFPNIDLITCRNLLIYLQPSLQNKVFDYFNFSLNEGGYLFLGSSESIGDYSEYFETINHKWKIYQSRGKPSRIDLNRISVSLQSNKISRGESNPRTGFYTTHDEERILNRFLDSTYERFLPLSIIINDRSEVLHIIGDASKFLRFPTGKLTNNISKLINKDLEVPISTAIQKLFIKSEEIIYNNIKIKSEDEVEIYNLKFILLNGKKHQEQLGAIFFEKISEIKETDVSNELNNLDIGEQASQRISDLEQELQFTKENLQATIEELETSNEELQAANEELLASNEELQSTNEELQSVNEELHTVNSEHQTKILELTELNNDIENLINSLQLAVVFFDDNLELRKFTPKACEILKINETDLGRSFEDILFRWERPNLCGLIEQVHFTGENLTTEFSLNNNYYIVGVKPYLISSDSQSGVTLSIVEVTELHGIEDKLIKSDKWLKQTATLANIGGWEIDLEKNRIHLLDETNNIYEIDKKNELNIEKMLNFYTKNDRAILKKSIFDCMEKGTNFDLNLQIVTQNATNKNVRIIGKAEVKDNEILRVYGVVQHLK
ncbi:MAG: PAS domain-containing protein [Ignavibacteriae bacterium]|nr:PAS domain-containing protein [Ignavibacteriota bacterium]MCB9208965.1 PAS domain-containing protein [Ignavibacteriales bacterium]MCB9218114.1 PAS domain-containing protein [Ignavibacteriales bacterium]MCB9260503.1 PAS domain-containing protein [Ignavibacteriales bacterium]